MLTAPPWKGTVDVGLENEEHHIMVIATGISGEVARASVTTGRLRVNEEVSVELRQLYVTAYEGDRRVTDLDRSEVRIVDEGVPETIVSFERGDIPFTAVLMVDSSASMEAGKLASAVAGARSFVAGMRSLDEASLLAFSDRILGLTPFSGPSSAAWPELAALDAAGGTSLNDHLYLATKLLEQRNGRRTVVVLSDGIDVTSALDLADIRLRARQSQIILYWLRISRGGLGSVRGPAGQGLASGWRTPAEHERELRDLETTVEESGGRVVDVAFESDLQRAFAEVLQELRDQYAIGYYPSRTRHDGSWHRVDVIASRPGVRVRRCGYLDYQP